MSIDEILIRTEIATANTMVREVFEECLRAGLQSMPYCDQRLQVVGRITLKHIITQSIVPRYMAELAPVLGPEMESFKDMEARLRASFDQPVGRYAQEPHASITSDTALMKALAVMEHHDTSYLFVVDGGRYKGTLTIPSIASWMRKFDL